MRKTILVAAVVLGIAPAALAATGPPVGRNPFASPEHSSQDTPQLHAAAAHRKLSSTRRRARAAERHKRARAERANRAGGPAASPELQAIARCESGGNPSAVGGGGLYRGKYQFTYEAWAAVGGSGDPASAPEAEQDRRAGQLLASSGTGQWPNCG